jgi:hypothetical protein
MFLLYVLLASLSACVLPAQSEPPAKRTAVITGSLSYPSDYSVPRMIVCAEGADSAKIHCTDKRARDRRTGRVTYRLRVPAGSYYVFATIVNGEEPSEDFRGYKAYYSEFVTCGYKAECSSHERVKVSVRAGQTLTKIDPGDWFGEL